MWLFINQWTWSLRYVKCCSLISGKSGKTSMREPLQCLHITCMDVDCQLGKPLAVVLPRVMNWAAVWFLCLKDLHWSDCRKGHRYFLDISI